MTSMKMFRGNEENQPETILNDSDYEKSNALYKRKRKISPHKIESINESNNNALKDEEPIDLKLKEIDNLVKPMQDENLIVNNPQIKALWEKSYNLNTQTPSNNTSLNCVLNAQSQKFLNFIALQQQNSVTTNKTELLNKQLIQNSMNVLMQSIPAPSSEMSNFATVNLAFNALLVHALNFQQCVDRYLQQLQESLAITAYEKHIAACVAAAVNTTKFKNQNPNLSHSDSSSSPNNSCDLFQKSIQDTSVVDLSNQSDNQLKTPAKLDDPVTKNELQTFETKPNVPRPKKNIGRKSGNTVLVNGVLVKKSNFRGTSEEENEIDPNFRPIELDNGKIMLSERYPTVTLPGETLSSLIVKSSASATRLIRLLMKSFFMQDELAASSLSGEGIYKKRLDPNITEAIKCFIRKRHPQLKTGSINLCMTDVCVQARRVSNNQRSRTQHPLSANHSSASHSTSSLTTSTTNANQKALNASGVNVEIMSSNSPCSETSASFFPTMTCRTTTTTPSASASASASLTIFPAEGELKDYEDPSDSPNSQQPLQVHEEDQDDNLSPSRSEEDKEDLEDDEQEGDTFLTNANTSTALPPKTHINV